MECWFYTSLWSNFVCLTLAKYIVWNPFIVSCKPYFIMYSVNLANSGLFSMDHIVRQMCEPDHTVYSGNWIQCLIMFDLYPRMNIIFADIFVLFYCSWFSKSWFFFKKKDISRPERLPSSPLEFGFLALRYT